MIIKSLVRRAVKVGAGMALSAVVLPAFADPISLQGVCHLTSIVGGGTCMLLFELSDGLTSQGAVIRKAQVRVDGIDVAEYVNDTTNPVPYSAGTVSGQVQVACGTSHIITALQAHPGASYVVAGSLYPVLCPTVPLG